MPPLSPKVDGEFHRDQKGKAKEIDGKTSNRVALVVEGGGEISGTVVFNVMVLDVVVVERVPNIDEPRAPYQVCPRNGAIAYGIIQLR